MANLFLQPKSKFYWLQYRKPDGSRARFSTKLSRLNPVEVRRAKQLEAEYTLKERSYGGPVNLGGWLWVEPFLQLTYLAHASTLERYSTVWKMLRRFLREMKIESPAAFTRQHCFDYLVWRAKPDKKSGKYRAGHNTALMELKIFRIIMNEAVIRDLCQGNPCVKLKIKRKDPRRAPELTDKQMDTVRSYIARVENEKLRRFLEITFEIGRWQGCRINATRLNPMTDVKLPAELGAMTGTIRFVSKGKEFETMLHPKLEPLFKRLKDERCTSTWSPPAGAGRQWASLQWTNFIDHSGLEKEIPNLSHRAFRVTVATRMARKNVPLSKAKEFLKHASTTVHLAYQRLTPEDLADCAKAIE